MKSLLCGAGAPARERLEAKADTRKASAILAAIAPVFRVLIATLREIFDEAAYQRFLARGQMTSSPAAYDDFLREGEMANARRPRCC